MLGENVLSGEARRFLLSSVPSVPFLEAVLLLRAAPDDWWTCEQLARRLYVKPAVCEDLVVRINQAGLLRLREGDVREFCFAPQSAELKTVIDELARVYASHLIEVTRLIHSSYDRQAQRFADAFNYRKS